MKKIKYKGKTLYQMPRNTTRAELKRLIEQGAEFYIEENDEKHENKS